MKITDGYVEERDGMIDKRMFLTYSESEKQENEINKENAKLVFNWNYLTIPREVFEIGLTGNEVIIYSFIHSFRSREAGRFYFTNSQLGSMFGLHVNSVTNILKTLSNKNLIDLSYKRKADGGQIRFINLPTHKKYDYQLTKIVSSNSQKLGGNDNKINNNKINHLGREGTFSKREDISNTTFKEIAEKYGLPEGFVADCWDSASNWLDSKGVVRRDYRAFLMNWVKREAKDLFIKQKQGGTHDRVARI